MTNRKVYICFIRTVVMLAASPLIAAEIAAPPAAAPARHVFVVRVDSRTGKLVRRELAPPVRKVAAKTASPAISAMVDQSARAHGVDPLLIHSVIQVESNYDAQAVSPKGAEGLMQLTPPTARMLGVSNTFDPGENIEAGVRYLKYLQDLYRDDRLALAAYNAGPGAVDRFKAIPPYPETQKYVDKVGQKYGEAKAARSEPEKKTEDAEAGPVKERQYSRVEQFVDQDGRLHLQSVQ
ncbi:MAG TPA: lytic transglycosylase domain-containing protein [Bryobacteraceae bacterium]